MINNNVYKIVGNEGYGFYKVENASSFNEETIESLKRTYNMHFIRYSFSREEQASLKDEIKSLPINRQIQLLEVLEAKWNIVNEHCFSIERMKEKYINRYKEFNEEGFDDWLKEEVMPELFMIKSFHDVLTVCDFLSYYKKDFFFYSFRGYQDDVAFVWCNDKRATNEYNNEQGRELLFSLCFDNFVRITKVNDRGYTLYGGNNRVNIVPGFYLEDNEHENKGLSKYMKEKYNAKLANHYGAFYS